MKAVNLLPPDLRSGPKGPAPAVSAGKETAGGPGPFIVLGALALCVAMLAGYVLTSNTVKSRESELAGVIARSEATNRQVAALRPYADFQSLAEARIATVRDLATSRFDWEQALRDMARVVPADVTLASMEGTVSSETGGGGTRGALNVPAIEISGCTQSQTDVAVLMARLRNIDGVTRVSLVKSDKATALQSNITTGDGNSASQPTCGKLNAPAFELVTFFEGSASAAVAPTGPAAAPAATASETPAAGASGASSSATPAATPAAGAAAPSSPTTTSTGDTP